MTFEGKAKCKGISEAFHNFAIQIALIQYSGRSKYTWAFSETVKKMSKITYTASRFSQASNLQCELCRVFE